MSESKKTVFVVGLGPGGGQFLTVQAQSALQQAEVLCGYTVYIDLVRPLYPEKECYTTGMTREIDRCRWALDTARAGRDVALVCSGDAGVYGMASPLLELAEEYPDVNVEVVPGLTAALSGGAVLGAPLAHDFCVISLSDRLTPWEVIEKRLACAAQGDFALALYNPSSKGRPDYLRRAVDVLLANGKAPDTLCGSVRNIGREGQEKHILPLSQLRDTEVDMFTTVFVGNAATRALERADGHAEGVPPMNVVVFSGTTEGRELSRQLAALGIEVTVSVATPLGQEEQGSTPGVTVRCGRLLPDEMAALLGDAALCIDATHPYAVEATKNIKAAAEKAGVEYLRLLRPASPLPENCLVFESAKQAAEALAAEEGNLLLATGAKELAQFAAIPPERLYPRVLPTLESIAACEAANIPHRNIIAMQGPFSFALNQAMMEQFHIRWLVTKDGGAAGGFDEKAAAASAAGAQLVVIRRPPEQGETASEVLKRCKEMIR